MSRAIAGFLVFLIWSTAPAVSHAAPSFGTGIDTTTGNLVEFGQTDSTGFTVVHPVSFPPPSKWATLPDTRWVTPVVGGFVPNVFDPTQAGNAPVGNTEYVFPSAVQFNSSTEQLLLTWFVDNLVADLIFLQTIDPNTGQPVRFPFSLDVSQFGSFNTDPTIVPFPRRPGPGGRTITAQSLSSSFDILGREFDLVIPVINEGCPSPLNPNCLNPTGLDLSGVFLLPLLVPEPPSFTLLCIGIIGMLVYYKIGARRRLV
jgi:hypothetical protein